MENKSKISTVVILIMSIVIIILLSLLIIPNRKDSVTENHEPSITDSINIYGYEYAWFDSAVNILGIEKDKLTEEELSDISNLYVTWGNDKWYNYVQTDELTDEEIMYHTVQSKNFIKIKNCGIVFLELTIIQNQKRDDVFLHIRDLYKAKFDITPYSKDYIRVRFDNKPVQLFEAISIYELGCKSLLIKNNKKFIQELKNTKDIIKVEVPIYKEGNTIYRFGMENFELAY